ncbi:hypothetical protein [Isoptericola croceus]|uniref:hypothetical protein n=1 Tax=Isoptericola croceus TaxID=3031406 RepID=UPI0023F83129|nr:hypothetical protein [Isoptericola croceus]
MAAEPLDETQSILIGATYLRAHRDGLAEDMDDLHMAFDADELLDAVAYAALVAVEATCGSRGLDTMVETFARRQFEQEATR